jgi:putative membrane protein
LVQIVENALDRPESGLYARSVAGGVLMGLANLVPGISGGTMLLAAGIYQPFIESIAEVTTLRFRRRALGVLAGVGLAAVTAIALLAGTVKDLVVDHRWLMYSLFIGLTLGGVPVVWKLIVAERRRAAAATGLSLWLAFAAGLVGMSALAWVQAAGSGGQAVHSGFLFMLLAGTVAAAAMILPGVSGGYLFLVLGVYVAVLTGIESFVDALKALDFTALVPPTLQVVLPVGLGVILGMVAVSNTLERLLRSCPVPTLGVLMGLLGGAVVGLWPFQHGVAPSLGELFRGSVVTSANLSEILSEPERFPTEFFTPSVGQALIAIGVVAAGFAATLMIGLLGGSAKASGEETP